MKRRSPCQREFDSRPAIYRAARREGRLSRIVTDAIIAGIGAAIVMLAIAYLLRSIG